MHRRTSGSLKGNFSNRSNRPCTRPVTVSVTTPLAPAPALTSGPFAGAVAAVREIVASPPAHSKLALAILRAGDVSPAAASATA